MTRLARKGTMALFMEAKRDNAGTIVLRRLARQRHHRREDGNRRTGFSPASQTVRHSGRIGWRAEGLPHLWTCEHPSSGPFPCRINRINNVAPNSDRKPKTTPHRGHKPGAGGRTKYKFA